MAITALLVTLAIIVLNGILFGPNDFNKKEALEFLIPAAQGSANQATQTQTGFTKSVSNSTSETASSSKSLGVKPITTTPVPKRIFIDSAKDRFLLTFKSECQAMGVPDDLKASTKGLPQCPCIPDKLGKYHLNLGNLKPFLHYSLYYVWKTSSYFFLDMMMEF